MSYSTAPLSKFPQNMLQLQKTSPETQSTTTRAPSVTRRAAVTSEEKSTCPGESMRLIKKPEPSLLCLMKAKSFSESS